MKKITILGGGRFGHAAAESLSEKYSFAAITIVEEDRAIVNSLAHLPVELVCGDGIAYLDEILRQPDQPDWIVPAIPVHVAFEWMIKELSSSMRLERVSVPEDLMHILPNAVRGRGEGVYVSNADFICPDNCPEPDRICTYTQKPRPRILNQYLESIVYQDFSSIVIKSQQLVPGAGGFTPEDLFKARDLLVQNKRPALVSTACKCHGVMHAVKVSR